MTKLTFINGVPRCPQCNAPGEFCDGTTWRCSDFRGYQFDADCDVEVERANWEVIEKNIIKNGKLESIKDHVRKSETVSTKLSELLVPDPSPNHYCEMDPTDDRTIWICPVSGARFTCSVDWQDKEEKYEKGKFGKLVPANEWKITQSDGGVGG